VGESFERGARRLRELAAVRLGESTVERTTEDGGGRIEALLGQGYPFGPAVAWDGHQDARGRTVAYLTIDATGTRPQGPGGGAAAGRRADVAGVYHPAPPDWLRPPGQAAPAPQARYLAGLYERAEGGPRRRRQAGQVGMDRAELWVALTEGGNGLAGFCPQNFNRPDLVLILDGDHPASYLEKLAKALPPTAAAAAATQAEQGCRLLKGQGGAVTLAVLRAWAWPARPSAALRAQRQAAAA
jgi:hypothetical protein